MITLRGRSVEFNLEAVETGPALLRLSTNRERPAPLRSVEGFIHMGEIPAGFGWYLLQTPEAIRSVPIGAPAAVLPSEFDHLADGDVIRLEPAKGGLRTIHRKAAAYNHFLLTERCNNYCLMCSQPPRAVDDGWIVDEILTALPLIDRGARDRVHRWRTHSAWRTLYRTRACRQLPSSKDGASHPLERSHIRQGHLSVTLAVSAIMTS
jgi:hypothetical protein